MELGFIPNAFGFRRDGSLLVGDAMQRQIYRWGGKALQPLANLADITVFCLSDGIVDAQDRLYVGDIGYNFFDPKNKPVDTCVIACVDPDGRARVVAKDLSFPNGIVVTPDGKTLDLFPNNFLINFNLLLFNYKKFFFFPNGLGLTFFNKSPSSWMRIERSGKPP